MKHNFRFDNPQDALNWMLNHPLEKLYDEYGNYYLFGPYSNIIEYWYYYGDSEDENGNLIPGDWDYDKISCDQFLNDTWNPNDYLETY